MKSLFEVVVLSELQCFFIYRIDLDIAHIVCFCGFKNKSKTKNNNITIALQVFYFLPPFSGG